MHRIGGVLAACLLIGSLLTGLPAAHADGDEPQYAEFYLPPDPLPPGKPGDLIRTEPSRLVLEPSGACALAALMQHRDQFKGQRVGVMLSGGNIGIERFVALMNGTEAVD